MKYFAPTLYNMATVIQSCICILSKLSCAQSLFNHLRIYVTLYFLLRHDSVRASTQMLPACLSLLILNAAFSLLFFAPVLALDVTRWPPLFLFHPLNKQLHVGWIFSTPSLIAFSLLFSTPPGI